MNRGKLRRVSTERDRARDLARRSLLPLAGGVLGGLFFLWIAGLRVVTPTEVGWVMQLDWRIHYLGWHFFRTEPWHWPPGRIEGYYHAPDGTSVGFTDSIPLVAFLLKPVAPLMPLPIQYLGAWLLVCFVMQGAFGVAIARLWTRRASLQLLVAALFVLMPTLLNRVLHPALSAHWLILWALWLYLRHERGMAQARFSQVALGLIAGLTHPYLASMVLVILAALATRVVLAADLVRERAVAVTSFGAAVAVVLSGWWTSGLFTVSGTENLATGGFSDHSANLLAVITPSGWSTLLPELPIGAPGQTFEGFQYLGAGGLALIAVGLWLTLRRASVLPVRRLWPILVIALLCAAYASSPRVTLGSVVVADFSTSALERLSPFRVTGRFLWVPIYLGVSLAVGVVVSQLPPRIAGVVLAAAVALQLIDLQRAHAERRMASRHESFHDRRLPLRSPIWAAALPHYRHMVLYFPQHCGSAPVSFEWPAYLAGLYGLTINAGEVARADVTRRTAYCQQLDDEMKAGHIADDTIYLIDQSRLALVRTAARSPLVCSELDGIPMCITARSYETWSASAGRN